MDYAAVLRGAESVDPAAVLDVLGAAAREFGATDVVAYLVDFEQRVLEPLPDRTSHAELPQSEEVAVTMAGRAFLTREPVSVERPDGLRVWVPIIEGSDRTGVLAMTFEHLEDDTLEGCRDIGILAGYLIAAHTRCTDTFQLHRRRKAMSLAASMQWDLLPPLVLHADSCSVAARLEPAYEVGGDCFDYALNGPVLDIALIDAMGHGVSSASIASLALGCCRHRRRESRPITNIHESLNELLAIQFAGEAFATGQLAQLDLATGLLTWTNAGHPCPMLIRNGQVIRQLQGEAGLPWGLDTESPVPAQESLEPGDGILFFTDGVVDARTLDGEEFGIDRLIDVTGQCASDRLAPEEIVRQIVRSVIDHRNAQLRDDATVLLVEWRGEVSR